MTTVTETLIDWRAQLVTRLAVAEAATAGLEADQATLDAARDDLYALVTNMQNTLNTLSPPAANSLEGLQIANAGAGASGGAVAGVADAATTANAALITDLTLSIAQIDLLLAP
jgi:hypothetical protein